MKNLLIISPNFPPINGADMHRIRQSVSYLQDYGWNPIILAVKPHLIEGKIDERLLYTLPENIDVIHINAFPTRWTRKIGLGSLGLRSLWFYKNAANKILKSRNIDLIYFSTTMFPVMILGNYWKKKFGIPYVIDMQDPWHTDHYLKLPKSQRPHKFWFSYRLNKYMEPIAMREVNGIISVSQGYCDTLQQRYSNISSDNCMVIPFGAFSKDFEVLESQNLSNNFFDSKDGYTHIVYVGVCHNMNTSISLLLKAFKIGLSENKELFKKVRMHFIGTSYAPNNEGKQSVIPIAEKEGVLPYIDEHTNRVSYFEALKLLKDAHVLVMLGTDDLHYTASKLYPYIMAQKPLLAIFHSKSSVVRILKETEAGEAVGFDDTTSIDKCESIVFQQLRNLLCKLPFTPNTNWKAFEPYTAREMTRKQADFFNKVLQNKFVIHEHNQNI